MSPDPSLRILLVSDIHCNVGFIRNRLTQWLQENDLIDKINVVLCSGDIANLKSAQKNELTGQVINEYECPVAVERAEREIDGIMHALEKICPTVYYIPGNVCALALVRDVEYSFFPAHVTLLMLVLMLRMPPSCSSQSTIPRAASNEWRVNTHQNLQ